MSDNEPTTLLGWHYCGKFQKGAKVHVLYPIQVRQGKGRFKDIFKDTPASYFYRDILPVEELTVGSTPQEVYGGSSGGLYPGTYTLLTPDGHSLIGIPESLLELKGRARR